MYQNLQTLTFVLAASLALGCSADPGAGGGTGGVGGEGGTAGEGGTGGTGGDAGAGGSSGTQIGVDGGTAVSDDGRVKVEVPAGALSNTQTIAITSLAEGPAGALGGTLYEFEPSGLRFTVPVTLRLEYDEASLPAGLDEESLAVANLANGIFWYEVVGASIDAAQDTIEFQASHFSTYGLMIGAFGAPLSGSNVVPANASAASGQVTLSFDTSNNVLSYHVAFQDLEGDEQAATIRGPALAGATGPILHTLSAGSPKIGHWTYDESDEADLLAGRSYLSITSAAFPSGELRGQIEPLGPTGATSQLTVSVLLWDDLSGAWATNQIPPDVTRIEVEVSGVHMATLTQSVPLGTPPLISTLTVPKGMARRVAVRAYAVSNELLYQRATVLDIQDVNHSIQPTLWSATDTAPPIFSGVTGATRVAGDAIALTWDAASDDYASSAEITYLVYMATSAGAQDFSKPLYAAAPGETSYTVLGLAGGQNYAFVVRAMDPGGNIDDNIVEASASTFSAGTGQYVDAAIGVDAAGCGPISSPCRTITQALIQTPGNEPIYIARGVYNAAAGEVFPLQLKDGTALYGNLAFVQTLPTAAGGVQRGTLVPTSIIRSSTEIQVILGADAARVVGLYIEDGVNSNIATIDSDVHSIDVAWCVLQGPGSSKFAGTGLKLASDSSVRDTVVKDYKSRGIIGYGEGLLIFRSTVVRSGLGITVGGGGHWNISRNTVSENPNGGIYAWDNDGAEGGTIYRNWIHWNYWGIQLDDIWGTELIRNSIQHNELDGIRILSMETVPPISNLIAGNSLKKNGVGVLVWSAAKPIVVGNDIACNDYADFGSWGSEQIDARDNWWDHNPPTFYDDAESNLAGCEPEGVDVCIAETYAGTPRPLLSPTSGTSSCSSSTLGQLP